MNNVSINKTIHLSQHYTLGEMTKTGTGIPNIPSRVSIENLRNICENWQDYDELFIERKKGGRYWLHFAVRPEDNRRKNGFINA